MKVLIFGFIVFTFLSLVVSQESESFSSTEVISTFDVRSSIEDLNVQEEESLLNENEEESNLDESEEEEEEEEEDVNEEEEINTFAVEEQEANGQDNEIDDISGDIVSAEENQLDDSTESNFQEKNIGSTVGVGKNGPKIGAKIGASKDVLGVKAGAVTEASLFDAENDIGSVKFGQASADAGADLGILGIGAHVGAEANIVKGDVMGFGGKIGVSAKTGVGISLEDGLDLHLLGAGASIGPDGVSVDLPVGSVGFNPRKFIKAVRKLRETPTPRKLIVRRITRRPVSTDDVDGSVSSPTPIPTRPRMTRRPPPPPSDDDDDDDGSVTPPTPTPTPTLRRITRRPRPPPSDDDDDDGTAAPTPTRRRILPRPRALPSPPPRPVEDDK